MKSLHFTYQLDIHFSESVNEHSFTMKCIPTDQPSQTIHLLKKEIYPASWVSENTDVYGNHSIYGKTKEFHDKLTVYLEGEAMVDRHPQKCNPKEWKYRHIVTDLTEADEEMKQMFLPYKRRLQEDPDHFQKIIYEIMADIYGWMQYVPASTNMRTTAAEAFEQRQGVCQDYAHIMLAVCRYLKIPCLYVVGFMIGEGASHAWVRVFDQKAAIAYDIDPTNDRWVDDDYIEVLKGRDARDCIMNKGIYRGFAQETQKVYVIVK